MLSLERDPNLSRSAAIELVRRALAEDIGQGDWTTLATIPAGARARGRVLAKSDAVVAALELVPLVFDEVAPGVRVTPLVADGARVARGQDVLRLEGPAHALLTGERVALNLLQRASGIATLTRAFVDAVQGTRARIADTRKTVPGLRALDKYAVRTGGGVNHRAGLDGGVLIKENHIAAAGCIRTAVERARRLAPLTLRIEVEARNLAEVEEALAAGADIVMLDNMSPAEMRVAVGRIAGRALVEASGNVTLETVRSVAECGVDVISVGALTHSVRAADLSLLLDAPTTAGTEAPA
jgi:nicotinate-nucleotide pyrophosphorylase (carboxylating)